MAIGGRSVIASRGGSTRPSPGETSHEARYDRYQRHHWRSGDEAIVELAGDEVANALWGICERHVQSIHAGLDLEQFADHMRRGAGPTGEERVLAGIGFEHAHQIGDRIDR